jgi:hypothetical protein
MSLSDFLFQQQASLTELKQSNIDCYKQQKTFFKSGLKASAWIYALSSIVIGGFSLIKGENLTSLFIASTLVQLSSVIVFSIMAKKLFSLSPAGHKAQKRHLMAQASFLPLLKDKTFQINFVGYLDSMARQFGREYHNSYHYAGIVRNELDYFKKLLIQDTIFETRTQEVLDRFETLCVLSEELEKRLHTMHKLEQFSSEHIDNQTTLEKEQEKEKELDLSIAPDPVQKALLKML